MEAEGRVVTVLDAVGGTSRNGNAWKKRDFVIETLGQYPKKICMGLFGDKVNECPNEGETVKVKFDIESREWNGRWFTQINAWKVERQGVQPAPQQPVYAQSQPQYAQQTPASPPAQGDDLPF